MLAGALLLPLILLAQAAPIPTPAGRGATNARGAAPIDLTGYWVSLVTEDWRLRMVVAQKGDWDVVPLNAEGKRVAEAASAAQDEAAGNQCKAYGAAGIMRVPGRLHITWQDERTLRIDTDAGRQTRLFHFAALPPARGEATWQGHSVALWQASTPRRNAGGRGSPGGELRVTTTRMRPGYYFKHGVPYSGNAVMTEHFTRVTESNGDQYLFVTAMVDDPDYLVQPFVRTLVFKREPDASKWNPTPCSVK